MSVNLRVEGMHPILATAAIQPDRIWNVIVHSYSDDKLCVCHFKFGVSSCLVADLQMSEAVGLVKTLQNWTVVYKIILSTKTPEKKLIFGKGNFQLLTGRRTSSVI